MNIRAKQLIEKVGGNLIGIVLNNINMSQDESYYYYSGYYHDYYSKNEDEADSTQPNGKPGDKPRVDIKPNSNTSKHYILIQFASMELMKLLGRGTAGLVLIFTCIFLAGCQTNKSKDNGPFTSDPIAKEENLPTRTDLPGDPANSGPQNNHIAVVLAPGDSITVAFNDTPTPPTAITDQIKEDGSITLYYNEKFQAAGKTVLQLQAEIHTRYVPKYYVYMTPSVLTTDRFFSVGGEIHQANRYLWTPNMTVLRAIDAAGGFYRLFAPGQSHHHPQQRQAGNRGLHQSPHASGKRSLDFPR